MAKTIVFTEGTDPRILEAASRLLEGGFLTKISLYNGYCFAYNIPTVFI